jgi:hypothetical protein
MTAGRSCARANCGVVLRASGARQSACTAFPPDRGEIPLIQINGKKPNGSHFEKVQQGYLP